MDKTWERKSRHNDNNWIVMRNVGIQTDSTGVTPTKKRDVSKDEKPANGGKFPKDPKKNSGSPSEETSSSSGSKILKYVALGGLGAVAAGTGAVLAAPLVLGAIGFTSAGIAGGSFAAGMMSSAAIANGGGVAAGSLVAILQSAAAGGAAAATVATAAGAGGAAVGAAAGVAGAAVHERMTSGGNGEGGSCQTEDDEDQEEEVEDSPGPGRNKRNKSTQTKTY